MFANHQNHHHEPDFGQGPMYHTVVYKRSMSFKKELTCNI